MATWQAAAVIVAAVALTASAGEPVAVRYPEGALEKRLVLRGDDGSILARGELSQAVDGAVVTTRLVLRFPDGSWHDETVVFSQDGRLKLIRDRLIQSGPSFPRGIDLSVDGASGLVRVTSTDARGRQQRAEQVFELPPDLANGMVPVMLKNLGSEAAGRRLSLIVATPKPRLVRLRIEAAFREPITVGRGGHGALHYILKVEIGGIAGWFAPVVGRQPPDSHVWIADDRPPAYLRSDQPFFVGGPAWRIDIDPDEAPHGSRDHRQGRPGAVEAVHGDRRAPLPIEGLRPS